MSTQTKDYQILLAGFGGQGILFFGKIIAYAGLVDGKEVSWLPSYGPEMRGGTCNCSVCISEETIASPLVITPNVLIAMNLPSYDKFIDTVQPGGLVLRDSSLIHNREEREGVVTVSIPATNLASENNVASLANMIMLGALVQKSGFATLEQIQKSIEKSIPERKKHLVEPNMKAVQLGIEYAS